MYTFFESSDIIRCFGRKDIFLLSKIVITSEFGFPRHLDTDREFIQRILSVLNLVGYRLYFLLVSTLNLIS